MENPKSTDDLVKVFVQSCLANDTLQCPKMAMEKADLSETLWHLGTFKC